MEQSSVGYPLLLLDNETLAYILGDGDFRFTNLKFDDCLLYTSSRTGLRHLLPSVLLQKAVRL